MNHCFHYAFHVKDLESTRKFYGDILGCREGRSTEKWVDFDFFGNQISAHVGQLESTLDYCGDVEGTPVPIPHFGCIVTEEQFQSIHQKLEAAKVEFIIKPQIRYKYKESEQRTMFVLDFSGNPLEFKSFQDASKVYVQKM